MHPFMAEFLGTTVLILLGNGVVCNVVLSKTKGHNSGLIVIAVGWALAVLLGAMISQESSGAHLNPALSIAIFAVGKLSLFETLSYIVAQMLGGMVGAFLVYMFYRSHFLVTESGDDQLACFCNAPAIAGNAQALFCEVVATCLLVLPIFLMAQPKVEHLVGVEGKMPVLGLGAVGLLPVAAIVFSIGVSLGGTTGYAINPARDLAPRIIHSLVAMPNKRDSNWQYAWIPVVGPIVGALVAALIYQMLQ
jgi:glycerol uptake facilitator protein